MTCNKHLGVTVRVRKCNNTSNEKNNRIRGQSKFVCVCVCVCIAGAPLPRTPISFLDQSSNLHLITFQLLRTSHSLQSFITAIARVLHLCLS